MRIAVIGNSHLAALKLGWPLIKDIYPDVTPQFFGAIKGQITKLAVEDGSLVPTNAKIAESIRWTSGGLNRIASDMDAYFLVGMGFGLDFLHMNFRSHRIPQFYDAENSKLHLISENFARALMEAWLCECEATEMMSKVRTITAAPIVFMPCPYLTTEVLRDHAYKDYWGIEPMRNWTFELYCAKLNGLRRHHTVVTQPEHTVFKRMFTKPHYRSGAVRFGASLSEPLRERDYRHMNAEYGAACLRDLLAAVNVTQHSQDRGVPQRGGLRVTQPG